MPDVDLSTLSAAELRDLLDSTRQRGQAAQSYQILQEMAERRNRSARGAAAHPRVIALDFGDPLETFDDEPAPPAAAAAPRRAQSDDAMDDTDLSLSLDHRPPRRGKPPRAAKPDAIPPAPRPPRRGFPILGFSVGVALGLIMGLGLGIQSRPLPADPAAAVFPQAPDLRPQPAAASVAPTPAVAAPATQTAQVDTAAIPGPAAPTSAAQAAPEPTSPPPPVRPPTPTSTPEPAAAVEPATPEVAKPLEAAAEQPAGKACANAPIPAERTICGDPRLLRLQQELRAAYARALDAHSDRATLRQRQLAWAEARNGVTDPDRLAELYEARIKRLDAATEAARRAQ